MRFATLSTTTVLTADLPLRADATPTFVVKGPSGGTLQSSASVTLATTNTSVSGTLAAGATGCVVLAATGITRGSEYILGNTSTTAASEDEGGEMVMVKTISSTTVTFVRPTRNAYTTGPLFQSRKVSCSITGTNIASVGRHHRLEISYNVGSVAQPPVIVPFDVVRYNPVSSLDLEDLSDLDPILRKRLPAGFYWPSLRDRAWDMLMRRVAAKVDPGAIVGALDLTTPHLYLARMLLAETGGEAWEPYRERMAERFTEEFEAALGTMAVDNDQDGVIEQHEGASMDTIELRRG